MMSDLAPERLDWTPTRAVREMLYDVLGDDITVEETDLLARRITEYFAREARTADDLGAVVHGCPRDGWSVTSCCGKSPLELPVTDRITLDAALVNCDESGVA